MPFGCLTLGAKKDYNNPSEVTDKYDLGQIVKSEEFCEIFRAKDKNTLKMFTCKKFLKKDGRKVRKAAKNEIVILKMLKHPNILQLVDVYETRKEYFLFLELATGREVFDWILDQGYYSERDTSNVVRQVLEAVAYLHSLNIVHRNLKLENLVYFNRLKHSKIVISDFHLAKLETGLIKDPCGTPEYLAPEVVGRQRYGRPVDCWALGVIMYILLSGNPPFYDETDDDDYENHDKNLFRKILAGDYEFDSPYWDDISESAKGLVTHMMEKAVRVTTMMKRLRAPEQSADLGTTSPAVATSPASATSPAVATSHADPQAPSNPSAAAAAAAPEEEPAAVTEPPVEMEAVACDAIPQAAADVTAPPPAPEEASPAEATAPEVVDPLSRCNGEAPTPLQPAAEAGDE
ncbi:unnamed protein product, partial [Coregonus sp. 'balchen']